MDRIDAMQAFVAVADLQGFAPAARKLGLSPSGVTRLIAALEDRLGARLLQRTTRQVALTDVGARYLERARRILADVEEAEGAAEGERTRPSGRLVVSAPVGFGRLHVSPVMSAYLKRYPRSVRRIAAVGSHDQSGRGRRRSRGQDRPPRRFQPGRAPCRRDAAHRGRLARLSQGSTASRRRRRRSRRMQTIQFGATAAPPDWRFVEDGREVRVAPHAALCHQQRRRRDPVCRSGRRADAGAGLSGGRMRSRPAGSESCWRNSSRRRCRSTSSIRPRGCCRPRCGPSSIS